jgi:XRE family aerobic/anaerobic benzoate catabolism transcriptional regulator
MRAGSKTSVVAKGKPSGRAQDDTFSAQLGNRTRRLRARSAMTRKELAKEAKVSERHLANLEGGIGNPSVQILRQVARALNCSVAEMLDDVIDESPDWLLIRDLLRGRSDEQLAEARRALTNHFGLTGNTHRRNDRIALIGLRGAGKSTLGQMLAEELEVPFVQVSREVERLTGCSTEEARALYGPNAYRRYEHRALEEVLARNPNAVIATPGGLVSEPASFNLLLQNCFTIWLKAAPEEHMSRVVAKGEFRRLAGATQAIDNLRLILEERMPFYAKADATCDTTGRSLVESFRQLKALVPRTGKAFVSKRGLK